MARADWVLEIAEKFFWLEIAARTGLIPSARLESPAAEGDKRLTILDFSIHTSKTTPLP